MNSDDDHLRERTVASEQAWRGQFLDVRRDTVALPNGHHATREYIVHPGAVMVVPVLDDGRLVPVLPEWRLEPAAVFAVTVSVQSRILQMAAAQGAVLQPVQQGQQGGQEQERGPAGLGRSVHAALRASVRTSKTPMARLMIAAGSRPFRRRSRQLPLVRSGSRWRRCEDAPLTPRSALSRAIAARSRLRSRRTR